MMKKMVLLFLITLVLCGCQNKQELIYDKLEPKEITLNLGFIADTISIHQDGVTIKEDLAVYQNNFLFFPDTYFSDLFPGEYVLDIKNEQQKVSYTLKIINYLPLPIITKDDLFQLEDDEYYVLITQDKCSGCEAVKPEAIELYNRSLSSNNSLPKIYQLRIDDPYNKSLGGAENIQDVTSVAELRIQKTPTLIFISHNQITRYFVGSYAIGNRFGEAE
jgi:hypothetical protein